VKPERIDQRACTYSEVFLSETGLCERSFFTLSICCARSLQLLFIHRAVSTLTFTEEGFIVTRHGLQDLIISSKQDSVPELVQSFSDIRVRKRLS